MNINKNMKKLKISKTKKGLGIILVIFLQAGILLSFSEKKLTKVNEERANTPYIDTTDYNSLFSLYNSRGVTSIDNSAKPTLRYKIKVYDNESKDFYNYLLENATEENPLSFQIAYNTEMPESFDDYIDTAYVPFYFLPNESLISENEYVFYTGNFEEYDDNYVWITELNNLNVALGEGGEVPETIKVFDETGTPSDESAYINTNFSLDSNLAFISDTGEDNAYFISGDEEAVTIENVDRENNILQLRFSLKYIGHLNNYAFEPKIILNNIDTGEQEIYKLYKYRNSTSDYFYYEARNINNATYQLYSLIDTGLKMGSYLGNSFNPIYIDEEDDNLSDNLKLGIIEFENYEFSYIEDDSFTIEGVTETSVQFSFIIKDLDPRYKSWKNSLTITLYNVDNGTQDDYKANSYKIDEANDKYYYQIDNLDPKVNYDFFQIIDSNLSTSNSYKGIDQNIYFIEDLNLTIDDLNFFTTNLDIGLADIIIISLLFIILILIVVLVVMLWNRKRKIRAMNEALNDEESSIL